MQAQNLGRVDKRESVLGRTIGLRVVFESEKPQNMRGIRNGGGGGENPRPPIEHLAAKQQMKNKQRSDKSGARQIIDIKTGDRRQRRRQRGRDFWARAKRQIQAKKQHREKQRRRVVGRAARIQHYDRRKAGESQSQRGESGTARKFDPQRIGEKKNRQKREQRRNQPRLPFARAEQIKRRRLRVNGEFGVAES